MTLSDWDIKIRQLPVSWAGRFLSRFIPYRRSVVLSNIDTVFGDRLTPTQKKRLLLAIYSHVGRSIKELVLLRFISEKRLSERVEIRGHERLLEIVENKEGVLILTGHFGNWEFAPIGGIMNFKAFQGQFHFIRRTFKIKCLEHMLFRRYYRSGLHVIPKKNSLNQVCQALDNNHAVVFVLDQHAKLANRDGIAVEFFGRKAGTYRSLASLAHYTGVPVVPASSFRLPDGRRHVLEFHEPIHWQDAETLQESLYQNTLRYNQALEKIILEHPEQWQWFHKRWKLK